MPHGGQLESGSTCVSVATDNSARGRSDRAIRGQHEVGYRPRPFESGLALFAGGSTGAEELSQKAIGVMDLPELCDPTLICQFCLTNRRWGLPHIGSVAFHTIDGW
jgi:hypothetical protein